MDANMNSKPPSVKQLKNEEALKIYAVFLSCLIITVVALRRMQIYLHRSPPASNHEALFMILRWLGKRSPCRWLGRPSFGAVVLAGVYLAGNVALSLTILALYRVNHYASRFGWLAAANMALCVFFGIKNAPLSPLAAVSHTTLNYAHRFVGYTTVLLVLFHAILYTVHFGRTGRWATLIDENNIKGLGAGFSMLVLLMGILRHRNYRLFYTSHIAGCVAALVLTGLHRPDWVKKLPVIMVCIAALWSLDRIIRAARMIYSLRNNHADLYPLPDGCTRLILKKPYSNDVLPGAHCFLWLPRIRLYQAHPFTIVSNSPSGLELVVKSHKGFTRAVGDFAIRCPGRSVRASIDGPYGSLPDAAVYDKLILVAGGTGAAFTFGFLNRILSSSGRVKLQSIDFVWAVKRAEHLGWFRQHLHNIPMIGSTINVTLYVTSQEPTAALAYDARVGVGSENTQELRRSVLPSVNASDAEICSETDEARGLINESSDCIFGRVTRVKHQKMQAHAVLDEAMQTVGPRQRVLIAACGPKSLVDAVKDSADSCRTKFSCMIDVHCEDFGA